MVSFILIEAVEKVMVRYLSHKIYCQESFVVQFYASHVHLLILQGFSLVFVIPVFIVIHLPLFLLLSTVACITAV